MSLAEGILNASLQCLSKPQITGTPFILQVDTPSRLENLASL